MKISWELLQFWDIVGPPPQGTTAPVRDHGLRIASWMGLLPPHLTPDSALDTTSKSGFCTMARIPHWILRVGHRIQYEITDPALNPAYGTRGPARGVSDIPHRIPNENVLPIYGEGVTPRS